MGKNEFHQNSTRAPLVFLAFGLTLLAPHLRAGIYSFNGGEGAVVLDMNAAEHWSGGGVPPPGSDLEIRFKAILRDDTSWRAASLHLERAGLFLGSAALEVTGDVSLEKSGITLQSRSALRVGGAIEISNASRLDILDGSLGVDAGSLAVGSGCAICHEFYSRNIVKKILRQPVVRLIGRLEFQEAARITIILRPGMGGTIPSGEYLLASAPDIEGPLPQLEFMESGEGNSDLHPLAIDGIKLEIRDAMLIMVVE